MTDAKPNPAARSRAGPRTAAARLATLGPAVSVGLLGLLLAAFLLVNARRENRAFEDHLKALAQGYLAVAEQTLSRRVQDYAWWDEAVEHAGTPAVFDPDWAERNLGSTSRTALGIDGAFLLDRDRLGEQGSLLFASHSPEDTDNALPGLTRLAERASSVSANPPRPAAGLVVVGGYLHLAAASPLTVFDIERPPATIPTTILIFTSPLADAIAPAARVERWFGHLVVGTPDAADLSIPLADIDGRPLGSLVWSAERPGTAFLRVALPTLAAGLLIMGIATDRLWRRVRMHAAALESRNAALTESERRFQTLVRAVPVGLFRADGTGRCRYVNDRCLRFARVVGQPVGAGSNDGAEEAKDGLLFLHAAHPEDRADLLPRWHAAIRQRRPFQAEFRTVATDGEPCWVAVEVQPQLDETGEIEGFLGSVTDITALKRTQDELAGREEQLRVIADGLPALIGYIDSGGAYRFHNARIEDWYGVPQAAVVGRPVREVLGQALHDQLAPHIAAAFDGRPMQVEAPVRLGTGPERILSIQGIPHRGTRGEVAGLFLLATDVTERHRFETALAEALDRAEAANHAKSRFLAAASHDLRQPLHALGLFLDLLAGGTLTPPQRELLDRARQSFQGTEELLTLLLDISRLEAGVVEAEIGPVDLPALLERLDAQIAPEADAKGLRLLFQPLPDTVLSDPLLLERILRNLLLNAIRYTRQGGVLVGCRRRGAVLRIEVWDTGSGIAPDQLGRIFEEFYQVGNPERDARRGLGLGLAIVNRLARLLGHDVDVCSRVGRGSRFSLSVPLADTAALPRREPAADTGAETKVGAEVEVGASADGHLSGHRVAVVDDNPMALAAVCHFLELLNIEPVGAETGEALMEALAERGTPDAILADLRLRGGVDGTEVIAGVRAVYGDRVPGVLLTGDTAPDRVRQAVDSGYLLLHKPVRPAALIEALNRVLPPRRA